MKKLISIIYGGILSVILFGCSDTGLLDRKSQEINATLGSDVAAAKGDKVIFDNHPEASVEVNVLSVSGYRCPSDVVCVWEGNAKIGFQVGVDKNIIYLCLRKNESGCEQKRVVFYEGKHYELELLDVTPHPTSTNSDAKKTVKFKLRLLTIENGG